MNTYTYQCPFTEQIARVNGNCLHEAEVNFVVKHGAFKILTWRLISITKPFGV
jgi:hypothetical protein